MTESESQPRAGHAPDAPPARRFKLLPWWLALLVVVLGGAGGALVITSRPDPLARDIHAIRIVQDVTLSNPSATAQQFVEKLKSLGGNPSLYLEVALADREAPMRTAAHEDTPIGNGLTFALPEPVPRRSLREVRVWDDRLLGDKMIDRVDLGDEPSEAGQIFIFNPVSHDPAPAMPTTWLIGWALLIAAGAGVTVALVRFIALQVV